MGNLNRTHEPSEKRVTLSWSLGPYSISSGETGPLCYVPLSGVLYAGQMSVGYMAGSSLSILLQCQRFIPGVGVTFINIGSTFVPPVFGTSGVLPGNGLSLPATFLLMANDIIGYLSSGGSTIAINNVCGSFVVESLQDHKKYFGIASR